MISWKTHIKSFLSEPVGLFPSVRYRIGFVLGLVLFLSCFLCLFTPFGIATWIDYVSPVNHFALPLMAFSGGFVALFSHLMQSLILKNKEIRIYHLFLGFILDVLLITFALNALYMGDDDNYWRMLPGTLRMVSLLLGLGYILGLMILILIRLLKERKHYRIGSKSEQRIQPVVSPTERMNILDENGQLRLSLNAGDLLYIEAADNYVLICFRKGDRILKEMVRNTLKKIESDLEGFGCQRCHRSYLINMKAVLCIRKNGRDYEAVVGPVQAIIPISRVYIKIIKGF